MPKGTALVLGGGGVAGIAWMTGLLTGLAEAGADLTGADLIIGTSAGANVAAQVGSGLPLADLYARQADPERQAREIAVDLDLERLGAEFVTVMGEAESAREIQRRMGAYALAADTVPGGGPAGGDRGPAALARVAGARDRLVAVEASTGETAVFDRDSRGEPGRRGRGQQRRARRLAAGDDRRPPLRRRRGPVRGQRRPGRGLVRDRDRLAAGLRLTAAAAAAARGGRHPARQRLGGDRPHAGRGLGRRDRRQPARPRHPHPRRRGRPAPRAARACPGARTGRPGTRRGSPGAPSRGRTSRRPGPARTARAIGCRTCRQGWPTGPGCW